MLMLRPSRLQTFEALRPSSRYRAIRQTLAEVRESE